MKVCFTVDVEGSIYGISLKGMDKVLDLFNDFDVYATFFVEGETLVRETGLPSVLRDYGHEIALHGNSHEPWAKGDLKAKERDIRSGKHAFARVVKEEPLGFRAPYFNMNGYTLSILQKEGFKYDSSVIPTFFRFGDGKMVFQLDKHQTIGTEIVEIPISAFLRIFPLTLGYVNLLGIPLFKDLTRIFRKKLLVFALHSWISQKSVWIEYTVPKFLRGYCATRQSPFKVLNEYLIFLKETCNPEFVCMRDVANA